MRSTIDEHSHGATYLELDAVSGERDEQQLRSVNGGGRQHFVRFTAEQHVGRVADVLQVLRPRSRRQVRQIIVPGDVAHLVEAEFYAAIIRHMNYQT